MNSCGDKATDMDLITIKHKVGKGHWMQLDKHAEPSVTRYFETQIRSLMSFLPEERVVDIIRKELVYEINKTVAEKEKDKALAAVVRSHMKFGFNEGGRARFDDWKANDFEGYFEELWSEGQQHFYLDSFILAHFEALWMHSFRDNKLHLHVRGSGFIRYSYSKKQVRAVMEREWIKEKQRVQTLF